MLAVPRAPKPEKKPLASGDVQLSESKESIGRCGISTVSETNASAADITEANADGASLPTAAGDAGDAEKGLANRLTKNYSSIIAE